MQNTANGNAPVDAPAVVAPTLRASVSFDMTLDELNMLVELCADNNQLRLGIMLAERKARLKSNLARMAKDLAAAAAEPAAA